MCSTPFGIKENRTRASIFGSLFFSWCSTPFGIKENRTVRFFKCLDSFFVLNAFRHQRESHISFNVDEADLSGAQRLSASKRIALLVRPAHKAAERRAQRLSASKRIAHCS